MQLWLFTPSLSPFHIVMQNEDTECMQIAEPSPLANPTRVALSHLSDSHQLQPTKLCLKAHAFQSHFRLLFEV